MKTVRENYKRTLKKEPVTLEMLKAELEECLRMKLTKLDPPTLKVDLMKHISSLRAAIQYKQNKKKL